MTLLYGWEWPDRPGSCRFQAAPAVVAEKGFGITADGKGFMQERLCYLNHEGIFHCRVGKKFVLLVTLPMTFRPSENRLATILLPNQYSGGKSDQSVNHWTRLLNYSQNNNH